MTENQIEATAQIGVVGLAVMGSNLARNFVSRGHTVAVFNRTQARTDLLIQEHGADGSFVPAATVADFVASLERPRRIIIMVQAGKGTDTVIETLVPHLDEGDIVVDGGNAFFEDTRRREADLKAKGLHFVGAGISGGEEGALHGPSIMPGGSPESYAELGPLLESISAKVDGEPLRPHGAGRRRPLREDGAQRHRVRGHAVHLRGVRPPARCRLGAGADRRGLPPVEHR